MDWSKGPASRFKVEDVFTPGGVPSVTYVSRDHLGLEVRVMSALSRRGAFIVISGPTKCGKSVLCKRVLGNTRQIVVQGGQVNSAEDFWNHVSHHLRIPSTETSTRTRSLSARSLMELVANLAVLQKKASADVTVGVQLAHAATFSKVLILDAIGELKRQAATLSSKIFIT